MLSLPKNASFAAEKIVLLLLLAASPPVVVVVVVVPPKNSEYDDDENDDDALVSLDAAVLIGVIFLFFCVSSPRRLSRALFFPFFFDEKNAENPKLHFNISGSKKSIKIRKILSSFAFCVLSPS